MTKKYKGVRINACRFQGEVVADPVFNNGYVFLTLRTKLLKRDANGQYIDGDQDVPLMVEPGNIVGVVEQYVKAGRRLHVTTTYQSWQAQGQLQHIFVVRTLDLGGTPYEPREGNIPPLPV